MSEEFKSEEVAAAEEIVEQVIEDVAAEAVAEEIVDEIKEEAEEEEEEEEEEQADVESEEELDEEDEYDISNETIFERLAAVKYIIAPETREQISTQISKLTSIGGSLFNKSGNFLWGAATTALLIGVPLSLTILAEQQLIELEKQFSLQGEQNNDLLTALPDEENQPDAK
ncbi:hypothetical protein ACO0SA_001530 [Hanseniaspora valbyensis]